MADPELSYKLRLKLIEWADLEVQDEERELILKLMERLHIEDPEDRKRVIQWLKKPPPVDDLDPYAIPRAAREIFVKECEAVVRADGVVKAEEADSLAVLRRVLFGDDEATRAAADDAGAPDPAARRDVIDQLNRLLQMELAGVSRHLHYSFLVFGPGRVPIVSFFRERASEGIRHAIRIGEKITAFGGHPATVVESPPEPPRHDERALLGESLAFARAGLAEYRTLLDMAGDDVALEELVRAQIRAGTEVCEEVEKMLREAAK